MNTSMTDEEIVLDKNILGNILDGGEHFNCVIFNHRRNHVCVLFWWHNYNNLSEYLLEELETIGINNRPKTINLHQLAIYFSTMTKGFLS